MNKRKEELARRKIINLIRPSNRKANCLVFYKNETYEHKKLKFEVFVQLQELGYEVIYSECIFLNGKRADLVAIKGGRGIGIEVLSSETKQECSVKLKKYPKEIDWFMVKDKLDITLLPI